VVRSWGDCLSFVLLIMPRKSGFELVEAHVLAAGQQNLADKPATRLLAVTLERGGLVGNQRSQVLRCFGAERLIMFRSIDSGQTNRVFTPVCFKHADGVSIRNSGGLGGNLIPNRLLRGKSRRGNCGGSSLVDWVRCLPA
jgi:hypothetical protein